MRRFWAILLAVFGVMATPTMAQGAPEAPQKDLRAAAAASTAEILTSGGTWTFTAPRNAPKGSPVCTETWTFRGDGSMTVVSGSQTVEMTWEMVDMDYFILLAMADISSTEGVDCMGKAANPADYPKAERRFVELLIFNDLSRAYVCSPALLEMPDGTKVPFNDDETCWGELRAVPVAVTVDAPTD